MSLANLKSIAALIDAANVYPLAKITGLQNFASKNASALWVKREDQQDVFSFKIRGAANRMSKLSAKERALGVVAASAGNHAQGIAVSAKHFGVKATIFMPITTPEIKTKAVREMGADIELIGDSYDEAYEVALEFSKSTGAVFIHAFDEVDVIAGQGTIAKEILWQAPNPLAAIYIGVGGGGLISGIGAYMKTYSKDTKIIAVEPEGAATLKTSLLAGKPTALNWVDGFADGVAVKLIGARTLEIAKQIQPEIILVSNDEICAAVKLIFEKTRTMVEPAGALALAGQIKHAQSGAAPKGDCAVIISGANVNFDRIGHMVERAELGAGGEILFAACLPEKPGSFLKFCQSLGTVAITEFNYRFVDRAAAHVLVGAKVKSEQDGKLVMDSVRAQDMAVTDLSNNRLAKQHLRHMVGGRVRANIPERIYSFTFPERPGALLDFLITLDGRWNISLFHYRNHGASTGQVLCGFQIPNDDGNLLEESLRNTGFDMQDETDNPAYEYFLRG
ncbi:MAG: threonine ammonia-lyase, biosynthetic [Robiginitomaculum sp.]